LLQFFSFSLPFFSLFFGPEFLLFAVSEFFPLVLLDKFSEFGRIFDCFGGFWGGILTVFALFFPLFWAIWSCFWPVFPLFLVYFVLFLSYFCPIFTVFVSIF
jgi:hypothetical protein